MSPRPRFQTLIPKLRALHVYMELFDGENPVHSVRRGGQRDAIASGKTRSQSGVRRDETLVVEERAGLFWPNSVASGPRTSRTNSRTRIDKTQGERCASWY